ncbi:MAG: endolytic transglycosylase MltG [Microbacteriaceae bacterium]
MTRPPPEDRPDSPGQSTPGQSTPGQDHDPLGVFFPDPSAPHPAPPAGRLSVQPRTRREAREDAARRASRQNPLAWSNDQYPGRDRKRRNHGSLWGVGIAVLLLIGMVAGAYFIFQPQLATLFAAPVPTDYPGNGAGSVTVVIRDGDTGSDVATTLEKDGVVKTYSAFYSVLVDKIPAPVFQPGAYRLAKKMSGKAALTALLDPKNKLETTAVIPEGAIEKDILPIVARATKLPEQDLQAAAKDVASFGLPAQATSLEGFLFPATYTFTPGTSAHDALKTMVDRSFTALDKAGVAPSDRWHTVVLAALIQKEAGLRDDYYKVSRVFLNRVAIGMDLQSDATVTYWTGNTGVATTTDAERADATNPYNTYVHPGLPIGPISNPGDLAIDAALHPANGPWLYFVTVNLKTGQTVFSETFQQHEAAVAQLQQWLRDNPGNG